MRLDKLDVPHHELAALSAWEKSVRSRLQMDQTGPTSPSRAEIIRTLGIDLGKIKKMRDAQSLAIKEKVSRIRESFGAPEFVEVAAAESRRVIDRVKYANNGSPPDARSKTILPTEYGFLSIEGLTLPSSFGNQKVNFVTPEQGNFHLMVEEFDDGDADTKSVITSWYFTFTPWEDGQYRFNALMWVNGNYVVISDDGWPNSREASFKIDLSALVYGATSGGPDFTQDPYNFDPSEHRTLLVIGDDNIAAGGHLNEVYSMSEVYPYPLKAGSPAEFVLCLTFATYVKGAGTVSEFDCTGPGDGVGCPFVTIEKV